MNIFVVSAAPTFKTTDPLAPASVSPLLGDSPLNVGSQQPRIETSGEIINSALTSPEVASTSTSN